MHRKPSHHIVVVLAVASAVLAGCDASPGKEGNTSSTGTRSSTSSAPAPATEAVQRAETLTASYDYDEAEKALAGQTSPAAAEQRKKLSAARAAAKEWQPRSEVPHIFYHSLVVDPARAFGNKNSFIAKGYRDFMVTTSEFEKQMEQMHQRGYVLVHPQRLATFDAQGRKQPPLRLPPGKKPFVLSVDDVNYYEYMDGAGFASDLFLTPEGAVKNHYTDAAGKQHVGNYDVAPIIDDFVRKHPDFSYQGDKGTLAVTGYNGVLGYRSSEKTYGRSEETEAAGRAAKGVATALKKNGWNFASHSWGHINFTSATPEKFAADAKLWDAEVKPIVGATQEMIYPFGADVGTWAPYKPDNEKFRVLYAEHGFRYFANVDWGAYSWIQLEPTYFRQGRINIDGITLGKAMAGEKTPLSRFFDVKTTIDPARRKYEKAAPKPSSSERPPAAG